MSADSFTPPQFGRYLNRLVVEFYAGASAAGARAFGGNLDRWCVFFTYARESGLLSRFALGHAAVPRAGLKVISANAVAASLDRPFETIRRHTLALIEAGLIERVQGGLTVPDAAFEIAAIREMLVDIHDQLVLLVDNIRLVGMALPPVRGDGGSYDPRSGMAAALDLLLLAIEFHGARHDNWIDLIL